MILCACGRPLHYRDAEQQAAVERTFPKDQSDVPVRVGRRTWIVQRHYIALHGLKAAELPNLKFPEVTDEAIIFRYLYDDGAARVPRDKLDVDDQIFTHTDPDSRLVRSFHIPKLRQLIKTASYERGVFELGAAHADFVIENHGVDEARIAALSEESLTEPGIMCVFADGSQLIVDGNHRLVALVRRGLPLMDFWLLPESAWRRAILWVPTGL